MQRLRRNPGSTTGRVYALGASAIFAAVVCALVVATASGRPTASLLGIPTPPPTTPGTTPSPSPTPDPTLTEEPSGESRQENDAGAGPPLALNNPAPGTGRWAYSSGTGERFGHGGVLRPYRVAVEAGLPVSLADFTAVVDATLGDYRGWASTGQVQFQRVSGTANFTVMLASPWTAYRLCQSVVDIRISGVPYTSCQAGAQIVINSDRYLTGSPGRFTGPLSVYRHYVINHEVGHRLGYGHVLCPGAGRLAPVMQKQTLGLQGCLPNAWPYPNNPAPPPPTSASPSPTPSTTTSTPTPTPTTTTSTATPSTTEPEDTATPTGTPTESSSG
jgi:hypothetical protein